MNGKIDASSTINLPLANEDNNVLIMPHGYDDLENFIKHSLLICYKECVLGTNLVKTPNNSFTVYLNDKAEPILVVDMNSIVYDPGCGEICTAWQPTKD